MPEDASQLVPWEGLTESRRSCWFWLLLGWCSMTDSNRWS